MTKSSVHSLNANTTYYDDLYIEYTTEFVQKMVAYCHSQGVLTMTAIGTSQEGADLQTIRQIALMCKMAGTDLHHIGDSGYNGIALPENILNYGIVIRGVRHTYSRIARSINR